MMGHANKETLCCNTQQTALRAWKEQKYLNQDLHDCLLGKFRNVKQQCKSLFFQAKDSSVV